MKFKGFSTLDVDKILVNKGMSDSTVRFIGIMRHLIVTKKDDFVITKKYILEVCNFGERKYRKAMKEAKDYIRLTRKRVGSKWSYTYELLKETFTRTPKKVEKTEENPVVDDISVNNLISDTKNTTKSEDVVENSTEVSDLKDKVALIRACANPMQMIEKTTVGLLKKVDYFDLVSILEPIFSKNKLENNKVSIKYVDNAIRIFLNNNKW